MKDFNDSFSRSPTQTTQTQEKIRLNKLKKSKQKDLKNK